MASKKTLLVFVIISAFHHCVCTTSFGKLVLNSTNDHEQLLLNNKFHYSITNNNDSFEVVQNNQFLPNLTTEVLQSVSRSKNIWLKLKLENKTDKSIERYLEAQSSAEYIDLYQIHDNGKKTFSPGGSARNYRNHTVKYFNTVFPINIAPNSEQTIYIKYQSAKPTVSEFFLWSTENFYENSRKNSMIHGFLLGMLLFLGLYHLYLYQTLKDQRLIHFVLLIFALFSYQFIEKGYAHLLLWPEIQRMNSHMKALSTFLFIASFFQYTRKYLLLSIKLPQWDRAFTKIIYGLFFLSLVSFLNYEWTYSLVGFLSFVTTIPVFVGLKSNKENLQNSIPYFLGTLFICLGFISQYYLHLIPLNTSIFLQNLLIIFSLCGFFCFAFSLGKTLALNSQRRQETIEAFKAEKDSLLHNINQISVDRSKLTNRISDLETSNEAMVYEFGEEVKNILKQHQLLNAKGEIQTQKIDEDIVVFNENEDPALSFIRQHQHEIYYIKSAGNYCVLFGPWSQKEEKLYRITMKQVLELASTMNFIQIHRSYLINPQYIETIRRRSGSRFEVMIKNDALPIGDKYLQPLRALVD